ncbi:SDR family NAD(P)-dependent oxidoreductase [Amycolatopsis saalfeldensis]|uniref:3-hydroxy acid dehydrogenase / malonic semialdehyde reductase n=1 Tax=Amycolatopsis saalfeldensis TaxID=394193 RepID=A0A1H8YKP1_9PSEU|nr:SDR family NAD(P)-dependent oxidoreductase [Amycolatopsis saalfeldensis]SEP52717.1 3-hydroxy acid dehydrogenase / malonic semialdehyde reductase [Amycolatopsis saalfeldensis]
MKTVFVTGASAGFGAAITRRFVAEGARVVAAARSADKLAALASELGEAVLPVVLDVQDAEAVTSVIGALPGEWGQVDVLVNNAGLAKGLEPAHRAQLADWDQMIATNVTGLVHVTRALLPGMVERGSGHVINIGSIAGTYPYPGGNVYGATKAFVHQFSLNLRSDLHGTGVRVTNVEPGMVGGTDFSKVRFDGDEAKAGNVYAGTTPLTAEDIAESVHWASAQPPHVNVNVIEIMPVVQSSAALQIYRES